MDFDGVADELYRSARADFVGLRDQRAKEAREEGDRELADRIRELRKPTVAAEAVNRLARDHPDDVGAVLDVGARLRAAYEDPAAEDMRELSRLRREVRDRLVGNAGSGAQRLGEETRRQVADTVDTAIADETAGELLRAGRLAESLTQNGAEQWLSAALPRADLLRRPPSAEPARPSRSRETVRGTAAETPKQYRKADRSTGSAKKAAPAEKAAKDVEREQRRQEQREKRERGRIRAAAEQALAKAETTRRRARAALDKARGQADTTRQEVERLRARLTAAEDTARQADSRVDQTARALAEAERSVSEAETELSD